MKITKNGDIDKHFKTETGNFIQRIMTNSNRRGGEHPEAGRPQSKDILNEKPNVSEYIDNLIIEDNKT